MSSALSLSSSGSAASAEVEGPVVDSTLGERVLKVEGVSLALGGQTILDNVGFEVFDRIRPNLVTGQVVGLLGPSGVGKTRLLRIIAGLDEADSGQVLGIQDKPLEAGQVGVVFQDYPLLKHRTVQGNLEMAAVANGLSSAEARHKAKELLERFRLADRARHYPAQLSGGQRQRVAIAQQLVAPKHLLLMDEPFSGLDPRALHEVAELLVEVANMDQLNTVVLVTHDIHAAMVVSDTLFMLGRGPAPDGGLLPGASIQASYDLVARTLAWRRGIDETHEFAVLEREIRGLIKAL